MTWFLSMITINLKAKQHIHEQKCNSNFANNLMLRLIIIFIDKKPPQSTSYHLHFNGCFEVDLVS